MKKFYLFLSSVLVFYFTGHAQPIFEQDFENGIAPMTLYDLDGHTPNQNVAQYPDAWNAASPGFGNGSVVAVSNSWYDPPASADDWMVTPAITIADSGAILRWEAKAQDVNFRDGYQVLVSTATNDPADFQEVLFETGAEVTNWITHSESLDDYVGKDIYIAFRNNSNDKFLLLVDNIFVGIPQANDVKVITLSDGPRITAGVALEGSSTIELEILNNGTNEVTSVEFVWKLNSGEEHIDTIDVSIMPEAKGFVAHADPVNLEIGDDQSLTLEIRNVNGVADPIADNILTADFKVWPPVPDFDLVSSKGDPFNLYEVLASGKAVVLDFFASWCVPCESSTPELNAFYELNGSGTEHLEVFGIDIEPTDTDAVVNSLNWGATYPKFAYSQTTREFYAHFNSNLELGDDAIPFFVMICPDLDDLGHSEINQSEVGYTPQMFVNNFQGPFNDCEESLTSAVEEISSITQLSVYPNPASTDLHIDIELAESVDMNIEVVDMLGRRMINLGTQTFHAGSNRESISTSGLANGIYLLRMTQGNAVKTAKFNVVH